MNLITSKDKPRFNHYLKLVTETKRKELDHNITSKDAVNEIMKTLEDELFEEAVKWTIRWKCENDLYFLGSEILGLKNAIDRLNGRKRLDPNIHKRMASEFQDSRSSLHLWPRDHMKSTWMKIAIVQLLLKNHNIRIGMWTSTKNLVKKQLNSIKGHFRNKDLLKWYPELNVKWKLDNAEAFTIMRDEDEDIQEAMVEAFSVQTGATGNHYDYHFYDDIITRDTVKSPTKMENVREWWAEMQSIKGISSPEKMVGTRYHLHDIYGEIIDEGHYDLISSHSCWKSPGVPIYSYYTAEDLEAKRRKQGDYYFSCQYENNPNPIQSKIFPEPTIYESAPKNPVWYIGVDPAASTNKGADQTGIAIACTSKDFPECIFFTHCYGYPNDPENLASHLADLVVQFKPKKLCVEFGVMTALKPLIVNAITEAERIARTRITTIIEDVPTGREKKAVKFNLTLGAYMRTGRAKFSYELKKLFRQFDTYNVNTENNKDDLIDACCMCLFGIPQFTIRHLPNKAGQYRVHRTFMDFFPGFGKDKNYGREKSWDNVFV